MKQAKIFVLLCCLFILISVRAEVKDGVYISPNKEFLVSLPNYKNKNTMTIDERTEMGRFVVYFIPNGDWKKEGMMSIEWYPVLNGSALDDKAFYEQLDALIPNYVATNFPQSNFGQVYAQKMQMNSQAAYRLIAIGPLNNIYTYWSATAVNYGKRTVIFNVLFPSVQQSDATLKEVPWQIYDAFINSFKLLN